MARKGVSTKVGQDKSLIVAEIPAACVDETRAVEFFERKRWGDTPCCVHCGSVKVYQMKDAKTGERNKRFLWRCHDCKQQYTCRVGTVLEDSRIPVRYWCYAFWAACSSKKGVSALQIKRQTGLSYKSALFLLHRVRLAMTDNSGGPLTGVIEADETYVGGKKRVGNYASRVTRNPLPSMPDHKTPVFAVLERGGRVRARVVPEVTAENLRAILMETADTNAVLMTDSSKPYRVTGRMFAAHGTVNHGIKEWAKYGTNPVIHTNTIEGFFGIFKRGIRGVYHNVSRKHLHRYVTEFEFRHNNRKIDDGERTVLAIRGANGKHMTYAQAKAS